MSSKFTSVILGFGAAGANAADSLRRADNDMEIIVVNAERDSFYLRLDLESLFFEKNRSDLMPRQPEYWAEKNIAVLQDRVVNIDAPTKTIFLQSGGPLLYDRLLIATGTIPRKLNIPGDELSRVTHFHTLADAEYLQSRRTQIKRIVIVGAGILGLELARVAVHEGWETTLLVRRDYVGSPIVDAKGSQCVIESMRRQGVQVLFREEAAAFEGTDGILQRVRTKSGLKIEADVAAICAGVLPSTAFLKNTSALVKGELVVNEEMETKLPDVFAAGDVAIVNMPDGRRISCNTWAVAQSQARTAAANMLGKATPWNADPLYNLDYLFDQELAVIGAWDDRYLPGRVLHEFPAKNKYQAIVTRAGIIEGALLLGDRSQDRLLRKLISAKTRVEGKIDRIFQPGATPADFQ